MGMKRSARQAVKAGTEPDIPGTEIRVWMLPDSKLPQQFDKKCQRVRSVDAEMVNLDIFIPATIVRRLSCIVLHCIHSLNERRLHIVPSDFFFHCSRRHAIRKWL